MIKELFQIIKKRKLLYATIIIFMIIEYIMALLPTRIIQQTIDAIGSGTLTQKSLNERAFVILAVAIIAYFSSLIWGRGLFNASNFYNYGLKVRLYKKLIQMRTQFYEKFRSGDMMTRFTSDTSSVVDFFGYGLMSISSSLATILFLIPVMFLINWYLTIFAIIPIIIGGVLIWYVGEKMEKIVEAQRDAVAALSNEVLEVVEGIRVTRAYANSELGRQRFEEKTRALKNKSDESMKWGALYGRIAFASVSISTLIIIGGGSFLLEQNGITLGEIVALQLYSLMLIDPMWMLSDLIPVFQNGNVSFGKLMELLNETDDMPENGHKELVAIENITFSDYVFKYSKSASILKNLNVSLNKGQTLGIVGKTGSGKTTFIRQLLMQYPVGTGQILINGIPITEYNRQSIEHKIGYVPQEHVLFSKSVQENLKIGKMDADILELAAAIELASFTQDLERMSDGIDTLVGEKGVSISGGQKQRISIARALIKDPELLILDDSLSAVDAKTEKNIIENIQSLRKGKLNIIVTHRLSAVTHADHIIVLDDGQIVEEGTSEQLIANGGWYYEQYMKQQAGEED